MNKERAHLLYGPPASGKSMVAQETSQQTGLEYLSVGEITRSEIAKQTERGKQLQQCLDDVIEYPVELISGVVEDRIVEALQSGRNFILDGYPKYPWEAEAFIKLMEKHDFSVDSVLIIDVPFEESLLRVANRRICDDCLVQTTIEHEDKTDCPSCGGVLVIRDDDQPEILKRRYGDYEGAIEQTLEVLDGHYTRLVHINGAQNKEMVISESISAITKPE